MQDSPSINLIQKLFVKNVNVKVHDPEAMNEAKLYFDDKI